MNKREFWLFIGLVIASASLPALGLWQQARYRKAERTTQAFVEAQQRAEAGEPGTAALFRQAQPEVQRNLLAGNFDAALQRLTALQDEDETPSANKVKGKALTLNQLWPQHTPVRDQAQQLLRLIAQKQTQGYDLAGAQEALLQVANAARQGDRKKALAAFSTVALLVRTATLRPGFGSALTAASLPRHSNAAPLDIPSGASRTGQLRPSGAGTPITMGKGTLPPVTPEQMQQLEQSIQTFQLILPQLMERATPEQRPLLQRLPPFLNALLAAYHAGKDIRPVMPFLQQFMAVGKRDPGAASALLDKAWVALNTARPLPKETVAKVAAMPSRFKHPSLPTHLPLPPATFSRSATARPVMPGAMPAPSSQRILQMLDVIRKLPEPVYQQQRPQIARYIDGAMAGMNGKRTALTGGTLPHAPRPLSQGDAPIHRASAPPFIKVHETPSPVLKSVASSVGTASKLQLDFDAGGQIVDLRGLDHDLAPGLAPGGLTWQTDTGTTALRGTPMGNANVVTTDFVGNKPGDVHCSVRYEAAGRDLTIHLKAERKTAGTPGVLKLRIPLQAAGWHWDTGSEAQVIAVDGTYTVTAEDTGKLPMLTLHSATTRLAVMAPTASAVTYDPVAGCLEVRFTVAGSVGAAEHLVELTISH